MERVKLTDEEIQKQLGITRKPDSGVKSLAPIRNYKSSRSEKSPLAQPAGSTPKYGVGMQIPTANNKLPSTYAKKSQPQPLPYAGKVSANLPQYSATLPKTTSKVPVLPYYQEPGISSETWKKQAEQLKQDVTQKQKTVRPWQNSSNTMQTASYMKTPQAFQKNGRAMTVEKPASVVTNEQKLSAMKADLANAQNQGYLTDYSEQWRAIESRDDAEDVKSKLARMASMKNNIGTDMGQNIASMNEYQRLRGELENKGINAEGVADWLRRNSNVMDAYYQQQRDAVRADDHPIIESLKTVPQVLYGGNGAIAGMTQSAMNSRTGEYRPIDTMGDSFDIARARQTVRETVGDNFSQWVYEKTGNHNIANAANFLYGTAMSGLDSAFIAALGGGATAAIGATGGTAAINGAASIILGSNAASETMMDVVNRGGSTDQAVAAGILSGAAETIFEKVSIEGLISKFKSGEKGFRAFIKNATLQGASEASEEMATEIANVIADYYVNGGLSEIEQMRQSGMTDAQITNEIAKRVGVAGAGGFLMGFVGGGSANLTGGISKGGKNRTAAEYAGLYGSYKNSVSTDTIPVESVSEQGQQVTPTAAENTQGGAVQAENAAMSLARQYAGQNISNSQATEILDDPESIKEMTDAGVDLSGTSSQRRKAVKDYVQGIGTTIDSEIEAAREELKQAQFNYDYAEGNSVYTAAERLRNAESRVSELEKIKSTIDTIGLVNDTRAGYNNNRGDLNGRTAENDTGRNRVLAAEGRPLGTEAGETGTGGRGFSGTPGGNDEGLRLISNQRERLSASNVPDLGLKKTEDHSRFSQALDEAKKNNPNGSAVDGKTVEELNGATTFLNEEGTSGVAVMPDGDITALFKDNSKNKTRNGGRDLIITAVASGGQKLDCYGKELVNIYAYAGMEPVARVAYAYGINPAMDAKVQADLESGRISKEPDIYFMKRAYGYSPANAAEIAENAHVYSQAELDALPLMEYDEAWAYRDSLINQNAATAQNGGFSMPETQRLPYAPGFNPNSQAQQIPYAPGFNPDSQAAPQQLPRAEQTQPQQIPYNPSAQAAETPVQPTLTMSEELNVERQKNAQKPNLTSYGENTVGSAQVNPESYAHLQNEYGVVAPGENPARVIDMPVKDAQGQTNSLFARTIAESESMPNEMVPEWEQAVASGEFSHDIATDKAATRHAERELGKGWDYAMRQWQAVSEGDKIATKNDLALGQLLLANAMKDGDTQTAMKLAAELCAEATRAGRSVQSFRLLKKMTPEGMLYYLQKTVNNLNSDFEGRKGFDGIKIDEGMAERLGKATTREEMNTIVDEIKQDIAAQTPVTWYDKWNAWRYLSMLGNPTTQVRNVLGNALFVPVVKAKNLIATGIEAAWKKTGHLPYATKAVLTAKDKGLVDFADNDFANVVQEIQGGGKYNNKDDILSKRQIFKTKWLEKYRVLTDTVMDKGDEIFSRQHYKASLAQYMKANGITVEQIKQDPSLLNKARQYAIQEAQRATYRDASAVASLINKAKRSLANTANNKENSVGKRAVYRTGEVLLEGFVPFTKTPVNIVKRGIEYSPIGLAQGTVNLIRSVKNGNVDAAAAIDRMAAGLTGSGLLALGAWLASMGLVSGGPGEDDREEKYKGMLGEQDYALKLGDTTYTIDWAAPEALPFFTGVELYKEMQSKDGISLPDYIGLISAMSDPIVELSMLSSVNSTFESIKYSQGDALSTVAGNLITSYIGQGVPTVGGKLARTIDSTSRQTYYDPNKTGVIKSADAFRQKVQAKIPFAENALPERVDLWGRTEQNTGGNIVGRFFYNMLSPGYAESKNVTKVDNELLRLAEATSDSNVYPDTADKTFKVNGESVKLDSKQYTQFAKTKGQTAFEILEAAVDSSTYKKMTDAEKADFVKDVYEYANAKAKAEISDYQLDGKNAKIAQAEAKGIKPAQYLTITGGYDKDGNGSVTQEEVKTVLDKTNLTTAQKAYMWKLQNKGWKNNPYE